MAVMLMLFAEIRAQKKPRETSSLGFYIFNCD